MKPIQNPKPIKVSTNEKDLSRPEPEFFTWESVTVPTFEWIYWNEDVLGKEIIFYLEELKKETGFQSHVAHGLRVTSYDISPKKVTFEGHPARFLTPTDLFLKLQNVQPKSVIKITYVGDTNTNKGIMKVFDVQRFVMKTPIPYEIVKTEFVPEIETKIEPF